MLPPLEFLPRDSFAFFMAAEANLTARKHLQPVSVLSVGGTRYTYDNEFTLITFMKTSAVVDSRGSFDAIPAFIVVE
jgi:hypothetical protein